jgi:hypothetical protein
MEEIILTMVQAFRMIYRYFRLRTMNGREDRKASLGRFAKGLR